MVRNKSEILKVNTNNVISAEALATLPLERNYKEQLSNGKSESRQQIVIHEVVRPKFDKSAFKKQLNITRSSESGLLNIGQESINEEENKEYTKADDIDYDDQ